MAAIAVVLRFGAITGYLKISKVWGRFFDAARPIALSECEFNAADVASER